METRRDSRNMAPERRWHRFVSACVYHLLVQHICQYFFINFQNRSVQTKILSKNFHHNSSDETCHRGPKAFLGRFRIFVKCTILSQYNISNWDAVLNCGGTNANWLLYLTILLVCFIVVCFGSSGRRYINRPYKKLSCTEHHLTSWTLHIHCKLFLENWSSPFVRCDWRWNLIGKSCDLNTAPKMSPFKDYKWICAKHHFATATFYIKFA